MIDMICKNDGELIFTLAEPKIKECISELRDNVTECTLPFAVKSEDCDISHLTPTQVEAFSDLRQCIEDKLNVCAAPDLISVYGVFHNALFRFNSCNDVHTFIANAFVPFVQYMSKVTKKDTNTV
ncbi:uncharacterized protein LOC131267135 [Anopheles coustani]|uniref:uncharacterized protein LOC131267135 n=1 Tax=Anopheles coustani TaxID=139045 RepID=UPI00265B4FC9|nr:uncharacterized protein LOC131267135 [Anopheles coustani]